MFLRFSRKIYFIILTFYREVWLGEGSACARMCVCVCGRARARACVCAVCVWGGGGSSEPTPAKLIGYGPEVYLYQNEPITDLTVTQTCSLSPGSKLLSRLY